MHNVILQFVGTVSTAIALQYNPKLKTAINSKILTIIQVIVLLQTVKLIAAA